MNRRQNLEAFASDTLRTLEDHDEWSADTLDEIALHATSRDLAHTGGDCMFHVSEPMTDKRPAPESITTTADRILATIVNGNRRDARDEFRAMKPGRAAAVAGYLIDATNALDSGQLSSVLRLLESCDES